MSKPTRKTTKRRKPATAKPAAKDKVLESVAARLANMEGYTLHLSARVRELERQLDLHFDAHAQSDWTLEPAAPNLPDPLAGCVVVEGGSNPYPLEAIGRSSVVDNGCVDFVWSMTVPMQSDSPTHPAPCRETGTAKWPTWIYRDLHTRPLPGDASCLLGENGVTIKDDIYNWLTQKLKTWMIGDLDENGNDRFPDFTIPRSTTWWKPTWPQ